MSSEKAPSGLTPVNGRACIVPQGHVADGRCLTVIYSETHPCRMHEHNAQMANAGVEVFLLIVRGGFGGDYHTTWFWRDHNI